jgi:hypothetical protein
VVQGVLGGDQIGWRSVEQRLILGVISALVAVLGGDGLGVLEIRADLGQVVVLPVRPLLVHGVPRSVSGV